MYTAPETQETFSENVDCVDDRLDDASSVLIILLFRIHVVCIVFFRISTQKALRATLLRGCFLVVYLDMENYKKHQYTLTILECKG